MLDDDPFPLLDAGDLAVFDDLGTREPISAGDLLYRAGDASYDLFVVTAGAVEIVAGSDDGAGEHRIARHGPGCFLGELNLLTGQRVFVTARVAEDGEVIRVPVALVRQLIATSPHLGDLLLTAFMARRALLVTGAADSVRLVGSPFDPSTRQLREFPHPHLCSPPVARPRAGSGGWFRAPATRRGADRAAGGDHGHHGAPPRHCRPGRRASRVHPSAASPIDASIW